MHVRTEKWYPSLGFVGIFALAWKLIHLLDLHRLDKLYELAFTMSGIGIAFLATMMSILFAIKDSPAITYLKEAKRYPLLVSYLTGSITWFFLMLIVAGLGLVLPLDGAPRFSDAFHAFSAGVACGALLSLWRIVRIMSKILRD